MEVRRQAPARGRPPLGSTALPSNGLRCTHKVVVKLVDAQMLVGMVVCMVLQYDEEPMDPWHIHPPPLDQTDMDGWCRSRGEVLPWISDVAWPPRGAGAT